MLHPIDWLINPGIESYPHKILFSSMRQESLTWIIDPPILRKTHKSKEIHFMSTENPPGSSCSDASVNVGWKLSHTYAQLPNELFEVVQPTPVRQPSSVLINSALANDLGLDAEALASPDQLDILAGNRLPPDGHPIAQAYAGHQFGGFSMLGDGRAILLGEQTTPTGLRFDIQLKGSGPTPYSRRGDGRASLGPMLREYVISHAMHCLGIPTTLSLAVVRTGEPVYRYEIEPGAVLTRVAASHIRVGTFQYVAARQNPELLRALADYTIARHYPELVDSQNAYLELLRSVIHRQAELVARWMCVGFIHGVMNTDNVSIAGETIDYGPCAFMNKYSPCTVYSSIDENGRYSFGNQPGICQWNLARFAETLLPLLAPSTEASVELATQAINEFSAIFGEYWLTGMRRKLGLPDAQDDDRELTESLLIFMDQQQLDFTNTFRDLTMQNFERAAYNLPEFQVWGNRWRTRQESSGIAWKKSQSIMSQHNPVVIPRNHRVEEALKAAVQDNDYLPLERLLAVLSKPFDELSENVAYREPPAGGEEGYRTFCGT